MKNLFALSFLLITICSFSQQAYQADTTIDGKIKLLLDKKKIQTLSDQDKKELKNLIYTIQNKGFELDEISHDYKGALEQTNKAISFWIESSDTISEANLRKYKGYLLGNLGQFSEAKSEIHTAIYLYQLKHKEFGVAVSQFDLSKVYDNESKFDSAVYFANSALRYWKTQGDTFRILSNKIELMHLFIKLRKYDKAEKIQKESEKLNIKKGLPWQQLIDFYFLSYTLFEKTNNNSEATKYKNLYSKKIDSLKKEGKDVTSGYAIRWRY